MFINRIQSLGLEDIASGMANKDKQVAMGKKLRGLAFQYLNSDLKSVQDGPAVIAIRTHIKNTETGGLQGFIRKQSQDTAWARDIELTLLAELLDCNLVVIAANSRITNTSSFCLSHEFKNSRPTIFLQNTNNTKWDAYLPSGVDTQTEHNGSCGYHAIARALENILKQDEYKNAPAEKITSRPVTATLEEKHSTAAAGSTSTIHDQKQPATTDSTNSSSTATITKQTTKAAPITSISNLSLEEQMHNEKRVIEHQRNLVEQANKQKTSTHSTVVQKDQPQPTSWDDAYKKYNSKSKEQYEIDRAVALMLALEELEGEKTSPAPTNPPRAKL
jgi:hypothetical protein